MLYIFTAVKEIFFKSIISEAETTSRLVLGSLYQWNKRQRKMMLPESWLPRLAGVTDPDYQGDSEAEETVETCRFNGMMVSLSISTEIQ